MVAFMLPPTILPLWALLSPEDSTLKTNPKEQIMLILLETKLLSNGPYENHPLESRPDICLPWLDSTQAWADKVNV